MLCFGVGKTEIVPVYAISYNIVIFRIDRLIFIWKTCVIGKIDMIHLLLVEFDITYVTENQRKGRPVLTI